ncbi:hypothetical protein ACJIZ3_021954 [Penstemon smallii]|uniref:Interactor of constitutive active ROPs 2, chloroplastic-like n=1 Tax=Penstemon smallii TaxID=265156 RepID=A0ABD3SNI3_9LAMI
MQTPKSRPGSLDVPQKPSATTPRTTRKFKPLGSDSDSVSPNLVNKTPKNASPKVFDRQSPRSPAEKKRTNRVSELESQLAHLQEELKKTKDQLTSSESCKKKAQQEAEESKKHLAAMSAKLDDTLKELNDISYSEEARIQELRKVSQDRDKAWESELEAVQKQHSMDSAALASALNEIQRLKIELNRVSESEASQARHAESTRAEIQTLRVELRETLEWVEFLKKELNESRESESQSIEEVCKVQTELEVMKTTEETLRSEHANVVESYKSLVVELDQSKNRVNSLEELVKNLKNSDEVKTSSEKGEFDDESIMMKTEVDDLKKEVSQLRGALESAEKRYHDEYIQSTLQIRNAYELLERAKSKSMQIEAELEAKVKESMAEMEELKMKLTGKEEVELETDIRNSESILQDLKSTLSEKERQLVSIAEENEKLKREIERSKINEEAMALAEAARTAEKEALMRLVYLTEEADKSSRKADRISEELDSAQAANSEMEAELRRLKVQADQWRKAAEAAASMLSTGNNGKDLDSYHTIGGKLDLAYSEDMDDDSLKKKNGNMLRKIGVLLKKGQK